MPRSSPSFKADYDTEEESQESIITLPGTPTDTPAPTPVHTPGNTPKASGSIPPVPEFSQVQVTPKAKASTRKRTEAANDVEPKAKKPRSEVTRGKLVLTATKQKEQEKIDKEKKKRSEEEKRRNSRRNSHHASSNAPSRASYRERLNAEASTLKRVLGESIKTGQSSKNILTTTFIDLLDYLRNLG